MQAQNSEPSCAKKETVGIYILITTSPEKNFNVVSTMSFGWYDVVMWGQRQINVKLMLRISMSEFKTSNNVELTFCV